MDVGGTVSEGIKRSRCASTARRSSSKKSGSFIGSGKMLELSARDRSRVVLAFGFKRLCHHLAVCFFQQDFYFTFRLFQLFLALSRKAHAFFKQLHRFVQRE